MNSGMLVRKEYAPSLPRTDGVSWESAKEKKRLSRIRSSGKTGQGTAVQVEHGDGW